MNQRTNYILLANGHEIEVCPGRPLTRINKDGQEVDILPRWLYCGGCGRRRPLFEGCKKRNCRFCSVKRGKKFIDKFLPVMLGMKNERPRTWTWLTLTGYRFDADITTLRGITKMFMDAVEEFLSDEYPDCGLATMELVPKFRTVPMARVLPGELDGIKIEGDACIIGFQKQFYIHAHAIVRGAWHDKVSFEERWHTKLIEAGLMSEAEIATVRSLTNGRRWSFLKELRDRRDLKTRLAYVLGYVAKGLPLDDVEIEALRRQKYVRTWGALYGKNMMEPTYDLICADCGQECYFAWNEDHIPIENRYPNEILKVKKVIREIEGPPNKEEAT